MVSQKRKGKKGQDSEVDIPTSTSPRKLRRRPPAVAAAVPAGPAAASTPAAKCNRVTKASHKKKSAARLAPVGEDAGGSTRRQVGKGKGKGKRTNPGATRPMVEEEKLQGRSAGQEVEDTTKVETPKVESSAGTTIRDGSCLVAEEEQHQDARVGRGEGGDAAEVDVEVNAVENPHVPTDRPLDANPVMDDSNDIQQDLPVVNTEGALCESACVSLDEGNQGTVSLEIASRETDNVQPRAESATSSTTEGFVGSETPFQSVLVQSEHTNDIIAPASIATVSDGSATVRVPNVAEATQLPPMREATLGDPAEFVGQSSAPECNTSGAVVTQAPTIPTGTMDNIGGHFSQSQPNPPLGTSSAGYLSMLQDLLQKSRMDRALAAARYLQQTSVPSHSRKRDRNQMEADAVDGPDSGNVPKRMKDNMVQSKTVQQAPPVQPVMDSPTFIQSTSTYSSPPVEALNGPKMSLPGDAAHQSPSVEALNVSEPFGASESIQEAPSTESFPGLEPFIGAGQIYEAPSAEPSSDPEAFFQSFENQTDGMAADPTYTTTIASDPMALEGSTADPALEALPSNQQFVPSYGSSLGPVLQESAPFQVTALTTPVPPTSSKMDTIPSPSYYHPTFPATQGTSMTALTYPTSPRSDILTPGSNTFDYQMAINANTMNPGTTAPAGAIGGVNALSENAPDAGTFTEEPVTFRGRIFSVGLVVVVEGVDGGEYYGQIVRFFRARRNPDPRGWLAEDENLYFHMYWLDPNNEQHKLAVYGIPVSQGASDPSSAQHVTLESMTCIKRIVEPPRKPSRTTSMPLSEQRGIVHPMVPYPANGGKAAKHLQVSAVVPGTTTAEVEIVDILKSMPTDNELEKLQRLANDNRIKSGKFSDMVASLLTSHVKLFMDLFGDTFINWISWMQESDAKRFRDYIAKVCKSEFLKAEHLAQGGDPGNFPATCMASQSNDLHSVHGGTAHSRFLFNLFTTHFVEPADLPARVRLFLNTAAEFAKTFEPDSFGFSPLHLYKTMEFYPLHLNQLGRIAGALPEFTATLPYDALTNISILSARALPAIEALSSRNGARRYIPSPSPSPGSERDRYAATGPPSTTGMDNVKSAPSEHSRIGTLIPSRLWPAVYTANFPFNPHSSTSTPAVSKSSIFPFPSPDHHGQLYHYIETLCCRVISRLMTDYMASVLQDVQARPDDADVRSWLGNRNVPSLETRRKQKIAQFVQDKFDEEMARRSRAAMVVGPGVVDGGAFGGFGAFAATGLNSGGSGQWTGGAALAAELP
ncbi:hypothetical protein HK104_010599 [Borealophlyctis nickersoniae]|nr:hypothetical protein HK104_010599 [Borealophlyctis nickersoniae]